MNLFHSLQTILRLAAVLALLAVTETGSNLLPSSALGGDGVADRARLGSPASVPPGRPASRMAGASATPRLQNFARIPLSFEANQGQTDPQAQYLARGPGYTLFLTATEAVLALSPSGTAAHSPRSPVLLSGKHGSANSALTPRGEAGVRGDQAVVRMQLLGSNPAAQAQGDGRLPGSANYFLGNDASKWQTRIPTYTRVQYQEVYPGISLVYYGNQRQLEYDFQVAPGADPAQIRLRFAGAESLRVDDQGDLVVQAGGQVLLQHKPVVYQQVAGARRAVAADFLVQGQEVCFALGRYDRNRPLVIDPVLSYSTYLGASGGDYGGGIAVDAAGNVYVTGTTTSKNFPTANALQPALGNRFGNAFVAELSADGSALVYSTYLGGSGTYNFGDSGGGIAVDAAGNAYVTGQTCSADFPAANALQPTLRGSTNAFVAKIGTVVTPGPATQFQVSVPAQVTSGTPFDVTFTAQDANGLTAVGYLGTVTFSATDTDPGVVLPADYTFTASDQGVHTFAGGCTLITVGNQTLTATDTADPTITGNATVTVNPGP